jgi:hypothetical protein
MHCAIYRKGTDEITHFVRDCVRDGNDFIGTNMKLQGVNPNLWDVKWTEDEAVWNGESWDRTVSQLSESQGTEIAKVTNIQYSEAVRIREELAGLTYSQVETYIMNNVTDLASARTYLIKLSKVVLAIIKIMDRKA